jgi:hypothetical protein
MAMTVEGETSRDTHDRWRPPPILAGVATFLLGIVIAFCAGWVSRAVTDLGPVSLPWGLALASLSAVSLVVLSAELGRGPAFGAVLGWATGVVLWLVRPGEAVIASDALGYAFLLLPTAVFLVAAMLSAPSVEGSPR